MGWRQGMVQYVYCLFLVLFIRTQSSLTSAFTGQDLANKKCWLAKTRETFKLSDLQFLEAQLQARKYQCERLVLDAATGASLFRLSGERLQEALNDNKLPPSLQRCEWIASIVACGFSAEELVTNVRNDDHFREHEWETNASWTVDYLRMNDVNDIRTKSTDYTSKTILACLAQSIELPAALDPDGATDRLRLVDTEEGLFLTRILRETKSKANPTLSLAKKWSQRPFPYSSAINPSVADILSTLVLGLVEEQSGRQASQVSVLDPTCGSGTFLAYALARGANVQGWDTNPACVEGSKRNVQYMFDNNRDENCEVYRRDATRTECQAGGHIERFDCAIANLPWGRNSILYYNENVRILATLPSYLRPRAPCAFISRTDEVQDDMRRLGYEVVGDAHIPPLNFSLPISKKGKSKKDVAPQTERATTCVVTVAFAPE